MNTIVYPKMHQCIPAKNLVWLQRT